MDLQVAGTSPNQAAFKRHFIIKRLELGVVVGMAVACSVFYTFLIYVPHSCTLWSQGARIKEVRKRLGCI